MTSKEALKNFCNICEKNTLKDKKLCPWRSISNDYCDEYENIKKDLERLEELKKENQKLKETRNKQGKIKRKLRNYINFLENELKKKNLM